MYGHTAVCPKPNSSRVLVPGPNEQWRLRLSLNVEGLARKRSPAEKDSAKRGRYRLKACNFRVSATLKLSPRHEVQLTVCSLYGTNSTSRLVMSQKARWKFAEDRFQYARRTPHQRDEPRSVVREQPRREPAKVPSGGVSEPMILIVAP